MTLKILAGYLQVEHRIVPQSQQLLYSSPLSSEAASAQNASRYRPLGTREVGHNPYYHRSSLPLSAVFAGDLLWMSGRDVLVHRTAQTFWSQYLCCRYFVLHDFCNQPHCRIQVALAGYIQMPIYIGRGADDQDWVRGYEFCTSKLLVCILPRWEQESQKFSAQSHFL